MKRFSLFLMITLLAVSALWAQEISILPNSQRISVNGAPFTPTDTIRPGDSLEYRVVLQNTGNQTYLTPIDLFIRGVDSLDVDTLLDPGPLDTLNTGDTLSRVYNDVVEGATGVYAPNGGGAIVIVVWPSVRSNPNTPVRDSATFNLFYDTSTGIPRVRPLAIRPYPNPAENQIFLDLGDLGPKVDYVRITDVQGRQSRVNLSPNGRVDIRHLAPGRYWVMVHLRNGERHLSAFVKVRN